MIQGALPVAAASTPPAQTEVPKVEPTGMAKYDLNTPPDPKEVPEQFDPAKLFNLNQEELAKTVGAMDFTQNISQEDAAAIIAGGEGAVAALRNIVNGAVRQSFTNSTIASTRMIEGAISKSLPAVDQRVTSHLRSNEVRQNLRQSNPVFQSPQAAFMLDMMQEKFEARYPQASAEEITRMATEFLNDFTNQATPKPAANPNQPKETDWEDWFGVAPTKQ